MRSQWYFLVARGYISKATSMCWVKQPDSCGCINFLGGQGSYVYHGEHSAKFSENLMSLTKLVCNWLITNSRAGGRQILRCCQSYPRFPRVKNVPCRFPSLRLFHIISGLNQQSGPHKSNWVCTCTCRGQIDSNFPKSKNTGIYIIVHTQMVLTAIHCIQNSSEHNSNHCSKQVSES